MQKTEPGKDEKMRIVFSCYKNKVSMSYFTFAMETRSGFMPYLSHPNIVPSLPNAQITYNKKKRWE